MTRRTVYAVLIAAAGTAALLIPALWVLEAASR